MTKIHLVSAHFMSPLLLLLILSSHLILNKQSTCLALRFTDERDVLDWEELVDVELAKHLLSADNNELDYLLSLDRATRKPSKLTRNHDSLDSASDNLSRRDQKQDASEPWASDTSISRTARLQLNGAVDNLERRKRRNDVLFLVIVGTSSLVGIVGLIAAAIFWYKIHKRAKATLDAEYPSYGITGPTSGGNKMSPSSTISDRKLAQSAQMFHYQQQRQQMMAQEKNELDAEPVHSDDSDDEAPGGGDYTVYECPGLAPTGEMEVRNPLFDEPDSSLTSSASASHPTTNNHYPQPIATASSSSSPPQEKSLS
ncbi:unnamed protein product [Rotaria socialis]